MYEGRIKKFLRWFLKKENASMTVEASYIVPMTVVCIVVMCFLMIYAYNQVALSADSYYLARKLANVEVEKVPYNFQEEGENFLKSNLALPEEIDLTRKKGISSMSVTSQMKFSIPFMGKVKIQETEYACRKNNQKLIARYQQWEDAKINSKAEQEKQGIKEESR